MDKENFEKVTNMLTPKFRKSSNFNFKDCRKSHSRLWWRISSAAAVVALGITAAFNMHSTVHAEDLVKRSFANLNTEKSYKVEFYVIGKLNTADNQLRPDPKGDEITGTLFVINDNGTEKDRVEIDSITEIYDGETFRQFINNRLIKQSRSSSLKLLDLFNLDSLNEIDFDKVSVVQHGDSVTVSHRKNEVVMNGVFSQKSNKLIEAYVTTLDGKKLLGTKSIEYGVNLPENYFRR